ncbi:MAG: tetratricopeptide repeat protein [Hyphomonadaceae bacterium]|nr:tetratricopeptide repeat protein [Hyphomonadaceae bacterium]
MGTNGQNELLGPLEAAHRLGITSELLFQYTKQSFAKVSGLRALETVEHLGKTKFLISEIDAFDGLLAGRWPTVHGRRPTIPKAILDHLRAESLNQCSRCGSGIGVETAHIKAWPESQSHHHANLIRICSACHDEHDAQHSLPPRELTALKNSLIERTRSNLTARMRPAAQLGNMPRPAARFVGRESELLLLNEALRSSRSVMITGVGGIGKTELLVQALHGSETGRPVFWIDVEQYRTATDIVSALRTTVGSDGVACPQEGLPARLDALQACVVFDGIERAGLDDIDEFEDAITALYLAAATAQFVATSQVVLHKLSAEARLKVGNLDEQSSRRLLESSSSSADSTAGRELGPLLEFCEGHTLTLRLATALMDHYGGPSVALRAINANGVDVVVLPGRKRHSRATSLELCLRTAYEALSIDGRQLLLALAESPAGLFTHYLEGDWLALPDPIEALAELRRWHLVDFLPVKEDVSRTHMLGPIRAFVIERARRDGGAYYETVLDRLVHAYGMMVAVLELEYDDPKDTPYVLRRYGEELPNLLHTLDLARANPANTQMALTAVSIVRSLMRYFFVLRLPHQGAQLMHDAAELALSVGDLEIASGLILQLVALAQRAGSANLVKAGLALSDRLERLTQDGDVLADISMCRGIAAREAGDYCTAENYARKAFEGYRARLRASLDHQSSSPDDDTEAFDKQGLHNDISNALGLLGFSLLSLGRYEEAAKTYRHSLQHERGASVAVNRGQTLHQIGNCESHLGRFREAAAHYLEAAKIFHFVGMEEYLSNALGELGYVLLDVEAVGFLEDLDTKLIERGLVDLAKDTKRVFDSAQPLDHSRCIGIIRKLFGCITLVSLHGKGQLLGEFCVSLSNDVLVVLGDQLSNGERDQDEKFPLAMIGTALQLGLLVAEAEQALKERGDISRDTIGEMLRTVCNAHAWAQNTMRVVDWLAALLTRRWGYEGSSPTRLREFIENYDNDVVDYFELTRRG